MKEKLAACVTMQDSYEVFSSWETIDLIRFVTTLKNTKEYIDLTMRDDYLLYQAISILNNRGYQRI